MSDELTERERYAIRESGWIALNTGWKFLFGGSVKEAHQFSERGWLDERGFTDAGIALRDQYGRGKASLLDRLTDSEIINDVAARVARGETESQQ